jgi:hypothetical protein
VLREIKCEEENDEIDDNDEGGRQEKKMHKGENSLSSCSMDTTEENERARQGLGFRAHVKKST